MAPVPGAFGAILTHTQCMKTAPDWRTHDERTAMEIEANGHPHAIILIGLSCRKKYPQPQIEILIFEPGRAGDCF